jgi:FlaA1/EpsC-like NDP-sugar epimerase
MRRAILLICWLVTDMALFIAAYALAYFLRVGFILSTDFPIGPYLQTVIIITPLWVAVMLQLGIFRLTRVQSEKRNIAHILFSAVLGLALFSLAYYFLHDKFFSRLLLIYAGILSFIFTTIWHLAFDQWQRQMLRRMPPAYPLLVIGTNREAERFIKLLEERRSPFRPVAVLDSQGSPLKELAGVPVLGKLNKLEEVIKSKKPTHLIQCASLEHTINLMSVCRQHGMTYLLLPSVLGAVVGSSERIEGRPVILVKDRWF